MRSSSIEQFCCVLLPALQPAAHSPPTPHAAESLVFHDLSRQLRQLMKQSAPSNGGRRLYSRTPPERNDIRVRNVTAFGWRNSLLVERGALMHATSVERGDGCAIAVLDQRGVVHAWHDSLPGATAFDFRIIGAHVSQYYLARDIALLRPDRDLLSACLHGSTTQQGWYRRPGGSIFWATTVIEPIYLESAELGGYSHVTRFAQDPCVRARAEVRAVPRQYSICHGAIAAA